MRQKWIIFIDNFFPQMMQGCLIFVSKGLALIAQGMHRTVWQQRIRCLESRVNIHTLHFGTTFLRLNAGRFLIVSTFLSYLHQIRRYFSNNRLRKKTLTWGSSLVLVAYRLNS